jgi:hypothetical protein
LQECSFEASVADKNDFPGFFNKLSFFQIKGTKPTFFGKLPEKKFSTIVSVGLKLIGVG